MAEIYFVDKENIDAFDAQGLKALADRYPSGPFKQYGIGIESIYGPIGHGYWKSMFCNYQSLQADLERLDKDEDVKTIVLVINSPGGTVSGLLTTCDYIKTLSKPIVAFITGEACSAAFAIASSCDSVYIERDAITGCCGCYAEASEVKDRSILRKVFRSAISPKKNLSLVSDENAQKEFQKRIDSLGKEYLEYVSSNRGVDYETALKSFGEGLVVDASYALEAKMVDEIATFDEIIAKFSSTSEEDEGEGDIEDMTKEDISKMTSEQKAQLFSELCSSDPSLLSSVREDERGRILALNKLRDPGIQAVDVLVDDAIATGKSAKDIALDVLDAVRAGQKESATSREQALADMADSTQVVNTPANFDEEAFLTQACKELM